MSKAQDVPYRFTWGVPALVVELYVPTKVFFVARLDDILRDALSTSKVSDFIGANASKIEQFLQQHPEIPFSDIKRIRQFRADSVYTGYSIYPVAGMFQGEFENTTTIRMTFAPDLAKLRVHGRTMDRRRRGMLAKQLLRHWTHDQAEIEYERKAFDLLIDSLTPSQRKALAPFEKQLKSPSSRIEEEREFLSAVSNWLSDVQLFFNGYVMFRFSQEIAECRAQKRLARLEQEIWITSYRDVALVKVKPSRSRTTANQAGGKSR